MLALMSIELIWSNQPSLSSSNLPKNVQCIIINTGSRVDYGDIGLYEWTPMGACTPCSVSRSIACRTLSIVIAELFSTNDRFVGGEVISEIQLA